jgi:hypothetical protein
MVIALDLEGTLISSAVSQIPRPGLTTFLDGCRVLAARVVIFTAVSEDRFRAIAQTLVADGHAPPWFAEVDYVSWSGRYKDLTPLLNAYRGPVVLVDDHADDVHPDQHDDAPAGQGLTRHAFSCHLARHNDAHAG